ncbi:MAG TPA: hypothetical protein VFA54_15555 [Bryobacterales bacterium]|jgi:hypothetical protein|nr:hypothetical protein [Bryobacterales bacterium]
MKSSRRWLAAALLAVFLYVVSSLAPSFFADFEFTRYLEEIARSPQIHTQPPGAVRDQIVERAKQLHLPVKEGDVQVEVSGGSARVSVRYLVQVNLPGYTVKLHFAPSAGR